MAGGGKVQVATDEWRNEVVEERIRYSLVKVHLVHFMLTMSARAPLCGIVLSRTAVFLL